MAQLAKTTTPQNQTSRPVEYILSAMALKDEQRFGTTGRNLTNCERQLAEVSQIRKWKAGETIYLDGDDAPWVYQVVSGMVRELNVMEDGRRQVVDFYGVGEIFGISEDSVHYHTAEAVKDCVVRCFPRDAFLRLISGDARLAKHFIDTVMTRLHRTRERMVLLGRMGALQRVAAFLLRLSTDQGDPKTVNILMGRQDIADYLGLTIETVCRSITELKRTEIIVSPSARLFEISDLSALQYIAGGNQVEQAAHNW